MAVYRWWERWKGRLEAELDEFERRGLAFQKDPVEWEGGRVVLRGVLTVDGEQVETVVVYPDTFPDTRFAVFTPHVRLARHQNPFEGNLCLWPRAGIYWNPLVFAARVVQEEVPYLIRLVREGGPKLVAAEDPQGEPITAFFPYYEHGCVIVPEGALTVAPERIAGRFTLKLESTDISWLKHVISPSTSDAPAYGKAVLFKVQDAGYWTAPGDDALTSRFRGPSPSGQWRRMTLPGSARTALEVIHALEAQLPKGAYEQGEVEAGDLRVAVAGILVAEEVRQGVLEDGWIFVLRVRPVGKKGDGTRVFLRGLRVGPSELGARIPELAALRDRTVAIVGLGTLGAPLAQEFARAQVKSLRLGDPDFVDPGTSVRWLLGLEGAGAPKSTVLAHLLRRNYPYTQVTPLQLRIGDTPRQSSTARANEGVILDGMLDGASLLIDATAESEVSRALGHAAYSRGLAQMYLWSVDGFGGVVARVIPGRTGCFNCLERALADGTITQAPSASSPDQRRVQPRGCADPTFTGSSVDLSPLISQAARVAFSTLCEEVPGGYPRLEHDVFVLSLRSADGALLPVPLWIPHRLERHPGCTECSAGG